MISAMVACGERSKERSLVLNGTAVFRFKNGEPLLNFYTPDMHGVWNTKERRWVSCERRK